MQYHVYTNILLFDIKDSIAISLHIIPYVYTGDIQEIEISHKNKEDFYKKES